VGRQARQGRATQTTTKSPCLSLSLYLGKLHTQPEAGIRGFHVPCSYLSTSLSVRPHGILVVHTSTVTPSTLIFPSASRSTSAAVTASSKTLRASCSMVVSNVNVHIHENTTSNVQHPGIWACILASPAAWQSEARNTMARELWLTSMLHPASRSRAGWFYTPATTWQSSAQYTMATGNMVRFCATSGS
jgi:hypothetical protein